MSRIEEPVIVFLIRSSWDVLTASPGCAAAWSAQNPSWGQCAVTALLVQDILGGGLVRTVVDGFGSHYYNRLPDGRELDLTRSQFPAGTVVPAGEQIDREYVLNSPGAVGARTAERYRLLKSRFDMKLYAMYGGC